LSIPPAGLRAAIGDGGGDRAWQGAGTGEAARRKRLVGHRLGDRGWLDGRRSFRNRRQAEGEPRSDTPLAVDLELAAVALEDLGDEREPQPGPPRGPGVRVTAPEEALAEVLHLFGGHARPAVDHAHQHGRSLWPRRAKNVPS